MRSVMVFGSFDPLHEGHRSLFRQAKRLGERLIVVVARDANIRRLKQREPRADEQTRLEAVKNEPLVDWAVLGAPEDFFSVIERERPDVLLLGYDQTTFAEEELRAALRERGLHTVIRRGTAFHPERYKSSLLTG